MMQSQAHPYSHQATLAGYLQVNSERGRLYYLPESLHRAINLEETPVPQVFQTRILRPHRIHIARVAAEVPSKAARTRSTVSIFFGKLAGSKDNAKRFFRSFIAFPPGPNLKTTPVPEPVKKPKPRRPLSWAPGSATEPVRRRPTSRLSFMREREPKRRSTTEIMRPNIRHSVAGPIGGMAPHPIMIEDDINSSLSALDIFPNTGQRIPEEKPIAYGNGVSVAIALAEPVLFLQGFEQGDLSANPSTAMLRGSLHLKVTKSAKIKAITLKFKGKAITKWPEGIPPRKAEFEEVSTNMSHTWPFFNAHFPTSEYSTGADHVQLHSNSSESPISNKRASLDMRDLLRISASGSNPNLTRENKRLSLQVNQQRERGDSPSGGNSVAQRGYRNFQPGDYIYNFELPLDSHLPETIDVELGSVKYELEATIERAGAFRANLVGIKEVTVIRTPAEGSLEQVEPIAISRNWEDQLHYDIVISGKSFPLGAQVPIAFKLTPLAKVQCHRIKVFVTESIEYFCNNRRVHRTEPARKLQLFEKRAGLPPTSTYPGSTMRVISGGGIPYDLRAAAARGEDITGSDPANLLGSLDTGDRGIGPTEMEFNVQLPTCGALSQKDKSAKLHFDTTYTNIQVHHWIKIVLRLSRPDTSDPTKRRHFEISIDSPFHILSCRATQANTSLPAYTFPETSGDMQNLYECGCPGAAVRCGSPASFMPILSNFNSSRGNTSPESPSRSNSAGTGRPMVVDIAPPPAAHFSGETSQANSTSYVPRPMHIIRAPSYNPPAFDYEEPPPPLETPPPMYDSIASPTTGLADYFARLSDAYGSEDGDTGVENEEAMRTPTQRRSLVIEPLAETNPATNSGNWI